MTGSGAEETVWLAVQREWKDDPKGMAKILSYDPADKAWGVYTTRSTRPAGRLDRPVRDHRDRRRRFVVIERDNQVGRDGRSRR